MSSGRPIKKLRKAKKLFLQIQVDSDYDLEWANQKHVNIAMAKDVNKGSHVVVIGQSGYRKAEHRDSLGQFCFYTIG